MNFIQSPSYHGATLFSILLDRHSDVTCLGDTLPTRSFDQRCSCGEKVSACAFWREMHARLCLDRFSRFTELLPLIPLNGGFPAHDKIFSRLLRWFGPRMAMALWRAMEDERDEHIQAYLDFARFTREFFGTSVFIDGQKRIATPLALKAVKGKNCEIKILHLVRDPRGFFNSWKKYTQESAERAAHIWSDYHRRIESYFSTLPGFLYLRLRYEDLCLSQERSMQRVFAFLGVPYEDVARCARSPAAAHIIGNKMIRTFDGTITLDLSWRETVSQREQAALIEQTSPLFASYGYSATARDGLQ